MWDDSAVSLTPLLLAIFFFWRLGFWSFFQQDTKESFLSSTPTILPFISRLYRCSILVGHFFTIRCCANASSCKRMKPPIQIPNRFSIDRLLLPSWTQHDKMMSACSQLILLGVSLRFWAWEKMIVWMCNVFIMPGANLYKSQESAYTLPYWVYVFLW